MYMFHVRKCKKKGAWAVQPLKQQELDLEKVKDKFETVFESPVLMLVKIDGYEVLVQKDGELLFKKCDDMKKIKEIAEEIYA